MKGEISIVVKIIVSILLITIIGLITFFYNKNQSIVVTKTIEQEIDLKQKVGEGLLDLRATLKSDKPDDVKIKESLNIIDNIKSLIDSEYQSLRIEAQQGSDRIKDRLNKIAEVIPVSIEEAIRLVDNLIDGLEDAENLGTFGQDKKNDNPIIFNSDNSASNSNNNETDLTQNSTNGNTNLPPTTPDDNNDIPNDPNSPFEYAKYKQGIKPQLDRDSSKEIEGQTIPIGTKIGD